MLGGEMNAHLGYGRHDRLYEKSNARNGYIVNL
jgi:transposase-like protein